MLLGSRVVRGPDWTWNDQDGGEGHVGTITSVISEYEEGIPLDKATVKVCWDNGCIASYSISINGQNHNLRLLDSSPSGVKFTNFTCDGCGTSPILGQCWHCNNCSNFDLCTACYMEDKHNLDHNFVCKLYMNHKGLKLGKRSHCEKYQAKGIYPGACVIPIDDNAQLGIGIVIESDEVSSNASPGKCAVCWEETTNVSIHNLGINGQVELKATESSNGPVYYRDHLPLVTMDENLLYVGDRVCIHRLKSVTEAFTSNTDDAQKVIGEIGKIIKVSAEDGSVKVEYDGLLGVWRYPDPSVLSKIPNLSIKDSVRLTDNIQALKKLQTEKHNGFHKDMTEDLDKLGNVLDIDKGSVKVKFREHVWWINPAALELMGTIGAVVGQIFKESIDLGVEKAKDRASFIIKAAMHLMKKSFDKTDNEAEESERRTSEVGEKQYSVCWKDDPNSSNVYRMKSNPRGLMVIINIQKFALSSTLTDRQKLIKELSERKGSEKDVNDLNDLFSRYLNFKVCTIIDKPRLEILRDLRKFAENTEYKDYDCLAVCIMSHGKDDVFYANDGNTIKVPAVYNMFSNSECEVFRYKPKLFFVQACRGKRGGGFLDVADGPSHSEEGTRAQAPPVESRDLDMADMLIAYSSFEDYISYRHTEDGSYFIRSLVSVFREYADKEDIMTMLIRVNDKVYRRIHGSSYGRTQVPASIPTLRKKMYFWPKMNFDEEP